MPATSRENIMAPNKIVMQLMKQRSNPVHAEGGGYATKTKRTFFEHFKSSLFAQRRAHAARFSCGLLGRLNNVHLG